MKYKVTIGLQLGKTKQNKTYLNYNNVLTRKIHIGKHDICEN